MRTWLVVSALGLWACRQPVIFQGESTLPVVGTPPPRVAEVKPPPRVEVRDDKIEIHEKIQFDFDRATIKEASFGLMNEIVAVINKNPHLKRIRVEGFASAEGSAAHNLALSTDRAISVMAYLTTHGVAAERLAAAGYGIDRPIGDNTTEAGREQNRRVEFVILEQDVTHKKVAIDAATGQETVVEERHETVKRTDLDAAAAHEAKPTLAPHKKGG
jgi:outer membrane protein OmpA-like peptidoglycan-associated protein